MNLIFEKGPNFQRVTFVSTLLFVALILPSYIEFYLAVTGTLANFKIIAMTCWLFAVIAGYLLIQIKQRVLTAIILSTFAIFPLAGHMLFEASIKEYISETTGLYSEGNSTVLTEENNRGSYDIGWASITLGESWTQNTLNPSGLSYFTRGKQEIRPSCSNSTASLSMILIEQIKNLYKDGKAVEYSCSKSSTQKFCLLHLPTKRNNAITTRLLARNLSDNSNTLTGILELAGSTDTVEFSAIASSLEFKDNLAQPPTCIIPQEWL